MIVLSGDLGGSLYVKKKFNGKIKFISVGVFSYVYVFGDSRYYQ